jgi:hypothetical protein
MNKNQKTVAKVVLFGMWVRKHDRLTKAYLCLIAASVYGILAAREANAKADDAFEDLDTERQRPVLSVIES